MTKDAVWLDHIAHMVPDLDAATAQLEELGFYLSPLSLQSAPPAPGLPAVPTGTANRCVMLEEGYIEILGKVADDTPSANSLMANVARYVGVHLVAFGASDVAARKASLEEAGFQPTNLAAPQRQVETETGTDTARFSLAAPPKGAMAEAGMFFVRHETRNLVWQPRWVRSSNGITALREIVLQVADIQEAAERYARFLGVAPNFIDEKCIGFDIGPNRVSLLPIHLAATLLNADDIPAVPAPVAYVLETRDLEKTRAVFSESGLKIRSCKENLIAISGGPGLGCELFVGSPGAVSPWRTMP